MRKHRIKNGLRLVLFLSLGVFILYIVYREQSAQYLQYCLSQGNPEGSCSLIDKITSDLRNAKPIWLILTLVMYAFSNISRAIRWRMLATAEHGEIRTWNTLLATMIGYLANLAVPRLGEFVRAGSLAKYEKVDAANIMGTVVTDRLLDVLSLLIIFGLGMVLASGQILDYIRANAELPNVSYQMITGLILGALLMLGLVIFLALRFQHHRLVVNVKKKIKLFAQGILSIRKVKNMPLFLFHSINIWVMYYLMTYLPFLSFEATADLGPVAALLVFIFGGLGMVLPAPGGIGTFHAMVIAGLSIYGISGPDAFSFAMIIFILINVCINLVMGVLSLIFLPIINKNYEPVRIHEKQ